MSRSSLSAYSAPAARQPLPGTSCWRTVRLQPCPPRPAPASGLHHGGRCCRTRSSAASAAPRWPCDPGSWYFWPSRMWRPEARPPSSCWAVVWRGQGDTVSASPVRCACARRVSRARPLPRANRPARKSALPGLRRVDALRLLATLPALALLREAPLVIHPAPELPFLPSATSGACGRGHKAHPCLVLSHHCSQGRSL